MDHNLAQNRFFHLKKVGVAEKEAESEREREKGDGERIEGERGRLLK